MIFLSDIKTKFGRGPDKQPRDERSDKGKTRTFTKKDRTMLIAGGLTGSALTVGGISLASQVKTKNKKPEPKASVVTPKPLFKSISSESTYKKVLKSRTIKNRNMVNPRVVKRNFLGLKPVSESPILNALKKIGKAR